MCRRNALPYPPRRIFIRAFKLERELELWGAGERGPMKLLRVYPIAAASGVPGPKRREGDLQVPEGVYRIVGFNPQSRYHLSLRVNYPNRADRILGDPVNPGKDIFIHGNAVSAGCLAMTDERIEEIYGLCRAAKRTVDVHLLPCRFAGSSYALLQNQYRQHVRFWRQLEPICRSFDMEHTPPVVEVDRAGSYRIRNTQPPRRA